LKTVRGNSAVQQHRLGQRKTKCIITGSAATLLEDTSENQKSPMSYC